MVQINISGENAAEVLKDLTALSTAFNGATTGANKNETPVEDKPKTSRPKKTEEKTTPAAQVSEDDAVSLEQVQSKMKDMLTPLTGTAAEKDMRTKIKSVFADFGAVSTSTIKTEDYAKVLEAFEALTDDLD